MVDEKTKKDYIMPLFLQNEPEKDENLVENHEGKWMEKPEFDRVLEFDMSDN